MTKKTRRLNVFGKNIVTLLLILGCSGVGFAAEVTFKGPYDDETEQQRDARMAWWREARFGLFIHWGVYAVPAGTHKGEQIENIGEWIMHYGQIPVAEYQQYAEQFNPVDYDPEAWVRMAKDAGMKYIVITAKHHDGFAMYHSKVNKYNIVDATPFDRDPLKELAAACKKHGKIAGMGGSYDPRMIERRIKEGMRFILSGSDLNFMSAGAKAQADMIRELAG